MIKKKEDIKKSKGKLGVLIPGIGGAVSTTFIAGVEAVRRKRALPIGSLTQMGTIRLGKRDEGRVPYIKDFVDLANIEDLVFCGWDIYKDNCYLAAKKHKVLEEKAIEELKTFLEGIAPKKGIFNKKYVKNLNGRHIKRLKNNLDLVESITEDIEDFKKLHKLERCVMIWCGSTEAYIKPSSIHESLKNFERGLIKNDPHFSPSMLYAYSA
ncbi:MAG: inositol-3-phosphate synthase, partial [Thermodesulfobacteriota bacterium]|nr:inositol-3-phosphate synthase [Thermodesulfobacteriota bacterium]